VLDVDVIWLMAYDVGLIWRNAVTATHKLFVAAALVAAGFGVATLLGKPVAEMRSPQSAGGVFPKQGSDSQAATPSPVPYTTGGLRLVPDFEAVDFNEREADLRVDRAPPLLPGSPSSSGNLAITTEPLDLMTPVPFDSGPRAKLRNEAPRPLAIDSRAETTNEPPTAISTNSTSIFPPPSGTLLSRQDDGSTPSSFEQAPVSTPVITASYNEVSDSSAISHPVIPPPWPAPDEDAGPRTHVVIDGDSLARLAGRYLDDPRRGGEIFEANRGVLSDPDLLPIGTELVIPSKSSTTAVDAQSPQSLAPRAVAIHAAANGRLVPVRPIPAAASVVPRAQLSRPLPVE
jgi:nucleoid-associated protein YgaU